jgi:hypothetical protein
MLLGHILDTHMLNAAVLESAESDQKYHTKTPAFIDTDGPYVVPRLT